MAVDVAAICQGLATTIHTATGLDMSDAEPDLLNPPCGYVLLGSPFIEEPYEAFRDGLCRLALIVRLIGGASPGIYDAQKALFPYLGSGSGQTSTSLLDAIVSESTWSGTVQAGNIRVEQIGGLRPIDTLGGLVYIGCDIPLHVYATRL